MADSIEIFFPIDKGMTEAEYAACAFPLKFTIRFDQHDLFNSSQTDIAKHHNRSKAWPQWETAYGPAGAGFQIRARLDPDHSNRIVGYEVRINPPAVFIGQNVLLDHSVARSAELAFLALQQWLLQRVKHPNAIRAISLETSVITGATATFLFDAGNPEGAQLARRSFQARTELANIKLRRNPTGKNEKKPAFSVGAGGDQTSYLKGRQIELASYIKNPKAPSDGNFPSSAIRAEIYEYGERTLRLEAKLKGTALKRLDLTTPESWRRYGAGHAYKLAWDEVAKMLSLNKPLRARRPKPEQIQALNEPDKSIVIAHLAGSDVRHHPAVLAYPTELERQKFFSAVKVRLRADLRLDLSIPFEDQVHANEGNLDEVLATDQFEVPPELAPHSFTWGRTSEIARQMRLAIVHSCNKMVREKRIRDFSMQRLSAIDVGPPEYDPTLIDFRHIEVEEDARKWLNYVRKPLFPMLHSHGLGCFGDIPLSEVERNWEAMKQGLPVRSAFNVGTRQIVLTTKQRPDRDGNLAPTVTVTVETEPLKPTKPQYSARASRLQ